MNQNMAEKTTPNLPEKVTANITEKDINKNLIYLIAGGINLKDNNAARINSNLYSDGGSIKFNNGNEKMNLNLKLLIN